MIKPYLHFREVKDEIRASTDLVIYKYRDWTNSYHRKIVTEREAWFAEPHSLNDPLDMRPPVNFIVDKIHWGKFYDQLYLIGMETEKYRLPYFLILAEVEKRFYEAKRDPKGYFERNREKYINDRSNFERIGVFSCCFSDLNAPMWAYYGANNMGFAVGFKTVEFAEAMGCTLGYVDYSNTPIQHVVQGDNSREDEKYIFQKAAKWSVEEELRFATSSIGLLKERAVQFPPECVAEIVFGSSTSDEVIDQVKAAAAITLPEIEFYQVRQQSNAFDYIKVKV